MYSQLDTGFLMPRDEDLSALTRLLIVGASVSTLAVAGCVATPEQADRQVAQTARILPADEGVALTRASQRKDCRSVNAFLASYPNSRGVVPLLSSLSPDVLSCLSPRAVGRIPASTLSRLPPRVTANLPTTRAAQRPTRSTPTRSQGRFTQTY